MKTLSPALQSEKSNISSSSCFSSASSSPSESQTASGISPEASPVKKKKREKSKICISLQITPDDPPRSRRNKIPGKLTGPEPSFVLPSGIINSPPPFYSFFSGLTPSYRLSFYTYENCSLIPFLAYTGINV